MRKTPMLFCFVAWMQKYQGNQNDRPRGGGSFPDREGWCFEMFNFKPVGQVYYGWAEIMRGGIRIDRLDDTAATADDVKGVTVVFVARNPQTSEAVTVGWYRDATVSRRPQQSLAGRTYRGHKILYNLKAPVSSSHLLRVEDRVFPVPGRAEGGFGQSRLWYADQPLQRAPQGVHS